MLERSEIIKKYFKEGCSYEEIRNIFKKSGFHLSYRHLQRILQSLGFRDLSEPIYNYVIIDNHR